MEKRAFFVGRRRLAGSSFQPISSHGDLAGVEASLLGGVAEVGDGQLVFGAVERGGSRWAW